MYHGSVDGFRNVGFHTVHHEYSMRFGSRPRGKLRTLPGGERKAQIPPFSCVSPLFRTALLREDVHCGVINAFCSWCYPLNLDRASGHQVRDPSIFLFFFSPGFANSRCLASVEYMNDRFHTQYSEVVVDEPQFFSTVSCFSRLGLSTIVHAQDLYHRSHVTEAGHCKSSLS